MMNGEVCLETYFTFISNFSHDKAREVIEKEKELTRGGGGGASWTQLLGVLLNLTTAEKTYHSLTFLTPRSGSVFLRKEQSLKTVYQTLMVDCRNALELSEEAGHQRQVCENLVRIFQGRSKMIDVYEKLCNLSSTSFLSTPFREIIPGLTLIFADLKKSQCPTIASWLFVLKAEVGILLDFLTVFVSMQDWNFFDSIMLLQRIGETLSKWEEIVQARETRKLGFASSWFGGGSVEPQLYLWLHRLKAALMSKFSLYFYSTLSQQTSSNEMKTLCSKLSLDQPARLASYQKRLDAQSISILYDANGQPTYQGPGYHFHEKDTVSLAGLEMFPLVFSTGYQPGLHWPNVIMIISDNTDDLARDKSVHFFDIGVGATYFLHQIEPRFYVVIILEGRRNEKDSNINGFLAETVDQLRCAKVISSLKLVR